MEDGGNGAPHSLAAQLHKQAYHPYNRVVGALRKDPRYDEIQKFGYHYAILNTIYYDLLCSFMIAQLLFCATEKPGVDIEVEQPLFTNGPIIVTGVAAQGGHSGTDSINPWLCGLYAYHATPRFNALKICQSELRAGGIKDTSEDMYLHDGCRTSSYWNPGRTHSNNPECGLRKDRSRVCASRLQIQRRHRGSSLSRIHAGGRHKDVPN